MDTKHITTAAHLKTAGSEEGSLSAVFSTFDQIDRDGDVVLPSAITDGQEVPLVWAHDWSRPVGSGVVHNDGKQAVFQGKFWMDTDDGVQAFRKVRAAGKLQEYSWGFGIVKADSEQFQGQRARVIKATEIFEVSPVLVGAGGRGMTGTLSVKHGQRHRLTPAEVAEIEAIRRSVDTGALFEMEKARALGVALRQPSQYHLLLPDQQLQIEIIRARGLGVRV